jgi:hypothetical protein
VPLDAEESGRGVPRALPRQLLNTSDGSGLLRGQAIALVLLLLVTLLQVRELTVDFIWPRLIRGWEARGYTAWERSALLSEGRDFLEFTTFLRDTIPESGKVVFPPRAYVSRAGTFTELDFMRYFLFPRQVLNCGEPVEDCVRSLTGRTSYIVAIGGFPPVEAAEAIKDYVPFREGKGVYVPR